jgi:hypothetical protein
MGLRRPIYGGAEYWGVLHGLSSLIQVPFLSSVLAPDYLAKSINETVDENLIWR